MTDSILTAVQQHPFTHGLTPEHCATRASLGTRATYAKDDIIFAEGDQRHEFFLLLKTGTQKLWRKGLARRSRESKAMTWERMNRYLKETFVFPYARVVHSFYGAKP